MHRILKTRWASLLLAAVAGCTFAVATAQGATPRAVLLISVDGLRPDYALEADKHQLRIPNLRAMVREGVHATGVRGVLPTATYPSHTSLITGVAPATHGIVNNHPFDRAVKDLDLWYYYAWDLRAPTLWGAASKAGYTVGSVSWPVTVGATAITYNIPEYALSRTDEDLNLTRGASTPGLMQQLSAKAGDYITDNLKALPRDWARARYALELIRQKHTRFLTVHLAAMDHLQHRDGPFTPRVLEALEEVDKMIGQLTAAMRGEDPRAVVCIVSDHGFAPVDHHLFLDEAFVRAGLVTLKAPGKSIEDAGVKDWIARPWSASGSAAIVLKEPGNAAGRARVDAFLAKLAADPANGIASILDEAAIKQLGGAPTARYWVDMKPGFALNPALGRGIVMPVGPRGSHGHAPLHDDLHATFLIAGEGIAAGRSLGVIDMCSIAPTLASLMGVPFPSAEAAPQNLGTLTP